MCCPLSRSITYIKYKYCCEWLVSPSYITLTKIYKTVRSKEHLSFSIEPMNYKEVKTQRFYASSDQIANFPKTSQNLDFVNFHLHIHI